MTDPTVRTSAIGPHVSEGTRLLWSAMKSRDWTQGDLARALKTASATVNRWLHGFRRPNLRWALAMETLLTIPAASWNARPKRPIQLTVTEYGKTGTEG